MKRTERVKELLFRILIEKKKKKTALKRLASLLEEAHREKDRDTIESVAKFVVDQALYDELSSLIWKHRREILNRGLGKLFRATFVELRKRGFENVAHLPRVALLALAANHDIPPIKRIHDSVPDLLLKVIKDLHLDPYYYLGRRPLSRLLNYTETLNAFLSFLEENGILDVGVPQLLGVVPTITKEEVEKVRKELGRDVSWADIWVRKMLEGMREELFDEQERELLKRLHPDDRRLTMVFLSAHRNKINEEIRRSRGEDFFRHKFGKWYQLVLELKRKIEEKNSGLKKYRLEVPEDFVSHMAAQVVIPVCTAWKVHVPGVLNGPSIPVVIKDREGRIVGRIFFTMARGKNDGKLYLVHGDYEGENLPHLRKLILDVAKEVSSKYLGTSLVSWRSRKSRKMVAEHQQPWVKVGGVIS